MADEADRLKQAFRAVDTQNTGFFSRADLAKVFRELEEWSQDDLDELFDAVDAKKTGSVNYAALINYIFHSDEDIDEDGAEEDSDDDDADNVAMMQMCAELNLDLEQRVTVDTWTKIMQHLDVDVSEAETMYRFVAKELEERGENISRGVPLHEFLDDLDITAKDFESIAHLDKAIDAVHSGKQAPAKEHALDIACTTLAMELRKAKRPASDAWDLLETTKHVSKVGKASVERSYSGDRAGLVGFVEQCMRSPPMLPASAGQAANRDHAIATVEALIQQCRASGQKFTDADWDLLAKPYECLYVDKTAPGWDCTVAVPAGYKRLGELVPNPKLFKGGIRAGDIKQGRIGTCFLLGALGAIAANKEDAITHAFIKYDIDLGVYAVRFCVDGEWTYVIVDDLMPVDKNGRLLYARSSDPEELWAPILEKAFCKLNTCYEMCDGGRPGQAIYHLCGGCGGKFVISDAHKKDPKSYYSLLKNASSRGWLLTTTFVLRKVDNLKAGVGKCGEAVLPTGLVGGHVYSVLKLVEVEGLQLVQCRNPWGTGEWKGKFSDANAHGEWTPALKAATGWTGQNDGKFWMCIEDFVIHSGGVEYARTFGPQWKKMTAVKRFQEGKLQATASWSYKARSKNELSISKGDKIEVAVINPGWWSGNVLGAPETKGFFPGNYVKLVDRPVARFDFAATPAAGGEPMAVVVILSQPNCKLQRKFYKRQQDGLNYKDITYQNIELVVVGPDGKVALKREGKKRSVSGELVIQAAGQWKIYAMSLGGQGSLFSIRTYVKGGAASMAEVDNAHISEVPR